MKIYLPDIDELRTIEVRNRQGDDLLSVGAYSRLFSDYMPLEAFRSLRRFLEIEVCKCNQHDGSSWFILSGLDPDYEPLKLIVE